MARVRHHRAAQSSGLVSYTIAAGSLLWTSPDTKGPTRPRAASLLRKYGPAHSGPIGFWVVCICRANSFSKAEHAGRQAFARLGRLRRNGREFERSKMPLSDWVTLRAAGRLRMRLLICVGAWLGFPTESPRLVRLFGPVRFYDRGANCPMNMLDPVSWTLTQLAPSGTAPA